MNEVAVSVRPRLLERWAPVAGILCFVFVALALLGVSHLDAGDNYAETLSKFQHNAYQTWTGITIVFLMLAGLCFLWFLADLYASARQMTDGMLAPLILVSGAMFIILALAGFVILVAPLYDAGVGSGQDAYRGADPGQLSVTYQMLGEIGGVLFSASAVAASLMMGASSILAARNGLIPRWLGRLLVALGLLVIVGTIMSPLPLALFMLWILIISIRRTIRTARGLSLTAG